MQNKVVKIISGGQTGADRAALDFAIENGIATGGYVPQDRLAEDGKIPAKYTDLIETESSDPAERTRLNVIHSDATLILTHGELLGGSKFTKQFAIEHDKPLLHIYFKKHELDEAVDKTLKWLAMLDCKTLNIAGPRASADAAIYDEVMIFLRRLFVDH